MTESLADPYSVVIKRKTLPMGLLRDAAELEKQNNSNGVRGLALIVNEAFGSKSQRKRVMLARWIVIVLTMMIVIKNVAAAATTKPTMI
eukprot:scaffold102337_cov37-Cyclotella_meneghiniana.AAC.3